MVKTEKAEREEQQVGVVQVVQPAQIFSNKSLFRDIEMKFLERL